MFGCCFLETIKGNSVGLDLRYQGDMGGGLRGAEGEETVVKMCCMCEASVFKRRENLSHCSESSVSTA